MINTMLHYFYVAYSCKKPVNLVSVNHIHASMASLILILLSLGASPVVYRTSIFCLFFLFFSLFGNVCLSQTGL